MRFYIIENAQREFKTLKEARKEFNYIKEKRYFKRYENKNKKYRLMCFDDTNGWTVLDELIFDYYGYLEDEEYDD